MRTGAKQARNLAANWLGHGANLAIMLFLSPLIVHSLGQTEYGIWVLLMDLAGYMGICDLGVRASTTRHVILHLGRDDHEAVRDTIRTALGFFSAFGGLILVIGFALGWAFPHIFPSAPEQYHAVVRVLVPLLALNVLLAAIAAVFGSVIVAHERFDLCRAVDLAVLILRSVAIVLALLAGHGIVALAVLVVAGNVCNLLGNYFVAKRLYRRLTAWPLALVRTRLRELLGYGVGAFISEIGLIVINRTDLIVVGAALAVSSVAPYDIGAKLPFFGGTFLIIIGNTFFPPVQRAVARGEPDTARMLLFRQVRLAMVIGVAMYGGFIVFGKNFIHLWMEGKEFGPAEVSQAAKVLWILCSASLIYLPVIGCREVLAAIGKIRLSATIIVVEAVLNLAFSLLFVLVFKLGLAGVAYGTLVAAICGRVAWMPWATTRSLGIAKLGFILRIVAPGLATLAIYLTICLGIHHLVPAVTWGRFAIQVLLALALYVPVAFYLLVPEGERRRTYKALKLSRCVQCNRTDSDAD